MLAGILFSFPILPSILTALNMPELHGPVVPATAHVEVTLVRPIPVFLLLCGLCLSLALLVSSSLNPFLYFRF